MDLHSAKSAACKYQWFSHMRKGTGKVLFFFVTSHNKLICDVLPAKQPETAPQSQNNAK
jgi:hypothetical protein